jgi:ribosomal protein S12 methylthiotransferase
MDFASLGVFVYSAEPNTAAASLGGEVPEDLRSERAEEITDLQRSVTFGVLARQTGKRHRILVDRRVDSESTVHPGCSYAGRYYGQAYEVDGEVYLRAQGVETGEFVDARILDADTFDLEADVEGSQRP